MIAIILRASRFSLVVNPLATQPLGQNLIALGVGKCWMFAKHKPTVMPTIRRELGLRNHRQGHRYIQASQQATADFLKKHLALDKDAWQKE